MNEKLKHTPGPWNEKGIYVILRYADKHDMDIEISDETMPWSREDAKLIAAAPEMLEALMETYKVLKNKHLYATSEILRNIIEKATGLKIEEVIK